MTAPAYPTGREQQLVELALRGLHEAAAWSGRRIGQFLTFLDQGDPTVWEELLHRGEWFHGLYPSLEEWPAELVDALASVDLVANLAGRFDTQPDGPLGFAGESDPFDLPFADAVTWFRDREVVTEAELADLTAAAQARAFFVGGVADRRLADRFHAEIAKALEQGTGFAEFLDAMDEAATDLDVEPFGLGRLSTVFRNQTGAAYQAGRYAQMKRATTSRPVWEYQALGDARPSHAAMDGVKAPHDHPVWDSWFPPNDHNCRCTVTSLTAAEAGPLDDLDADDLEAPGWPQGPGREGAATAQQDAVAGLLIQDDGLPAARLTRSRLRTASPTTLSAVHRRAMDALDRGQDASRLVALQARAGVDADDLAPLLDDAPGAVRLHPPGWRPDPAGQVAELALPSQDAAGLEELARRLAHVPELADVPIGTRTRISVRRGASDAADATVILDADLAELLSDDDPAGWISEAVLELRPRSAAEADALAAWVLDNAERAPGRGVVPFAGDVADFTVAGGGDAVLNVRDLPSGWTASAVTSEPLDGWTHYPVAVPGDLAGELD